MKYPKITLSRANNTLLMLIILINVYIVGAPFIPQLSFWWESHHSNRKQELTTTIETRNGPTHTQTVPVNESNQVIIPSMLLDQPILEGPVSHAYKILDNGIWRWPSGSTPDKGGNTVLIGHRFTYTNPKGVLYYLDKVQIGDQIGMIWQNKRYTYKVTTIQVVAPNQTSIENATTDSRLTIFTCTPLWLPKNRLVVTAELEP